MEQLVTNLKRIDGNQDTVINAPNSPYTFNHALASVYRDFRYLDEVNDFPTICLYGATDRREHIGTDVRYGNFLTTIRGYLKGSIDDVDNLIDDILFVIESMNFDHTLDTLNLVDARVISIESDEGLLLPYGLCDITVQVTYEQYGNV